MLVMTIDDLAQRNSGYEATRRQVADAMRDEFGYKLERRIPTPPEGEYGSRSYLIDSPEGVPYDDWIRMTRLAVLVNVLAGLKQEPFYMIEKGLNYYDGASSVDGADLSAVCENYPVPAIAAVIVRDLCEVDPQRKEGFQLRLKQQGEAVDSGVKEKLSNYPKYKAALARDLVETGQVATLAEARVAVSIASGVFVECSNLVDSADITGEIHFGTVDHLLSKIIRSAKETYGGGCSWCETTMVDVDGTEKSVAEVLMTGDAEQISKIRLHERQDIYSRYSHRDFPKIIGVGHKNKDRKEIRETEAQLAPRGRDFLGRPRK
jgi:hypothetical protein